LRLNDNRSAYIDVENNIGVLKMLLAQCMGLDTDSLELAIDTEHPLESPESLFVNHGDAVLATTEYRLLDKSVEAARLQKKITLGEFLPTVSISGGYMFQNFMGPSQNSLMGLVTVSIPVSWKAPHTMKKQKLACENAITQLNDGQEQLVIRMRKSQNDLCNAYQQAILAKKSIEQAAENLRLNENYYKAGISTMSDLLEAQTLFQQSKDRYSEAYSTYEIKKTEYLISIGR
ncbi:TolC family protein, partial [Bacteroides acidifaciens]|uniref:TolC family protein n=1 Tax=Bacteroides acidifaciens TaxID=85831 RepID=UPI00263BDD1F